MRNITIAVDDETYHAARVRAAERGTSVSAMVKTFLQEQIAEPSTGVREMPMTFAHAKAVEPLPPGAYGRFPDGAPYYTPGGKPRQPGAMRGMIEWTEDCDSWPDGFLDALYGDDTPASQTWYMGPANDALLMRNKE